MKNPQAILRNDRDTYLLSPCTENMFLVVELCQEILVHSVQLANFELFSSMVKSFNVYIPGAPPKGEWLLVDSFVANVRGSDL